jgi:hypothetical protein
VSQVIKDGSGTGNGNAATREWIAEHGEVEMKERTPQQLGQMWAIGQGASTNALQAQVEPIFSTRQRGHLPPPESAKGGVRGEFDGNNG